MPWDFVAHEEILPVKQCKVKVKSSSQRGKANKIFGAGHGATKAYSVKVATTKTLRYNIASFDQGGWRMQKRPFWREGSALMCHTQKENCQGSTHEAPSSHHPLRASSFPNNLRALDTTKKYKCLCGRKKLSTQHSIVDTINGLIMYTVREHVKDFCTAKVEAKLAQRVNANFRLRRP